MRSTVDDVPRFNKELTTAGRVDTTEKLPLQIVLKNESLAKRKSAFTRVRRACGVASAARLANKTFSTWTSRLISYQLMVITCKVQKARLSTGSWPDMHPRTMEGYHQTTAQERVCLWNLFGRWNCFRAVRFSALWDETTKTTVSHTFPSEVTTASKQPLSSAKPGGDQWTSLALTPWYLNLRAHSGCH